MNGIEKQRVKLRESSPISYRLHELDREAAWVECRYQRERRDNLLLKIRGSLVALNGASLVALLGLIGGGGDAAKWLGVGHTSIVVASIAFAIGLGLAGWALADEQTLAIEEAGDASGRATRLNALIAVYEDESTLEANDRAKEIFDEIAAMPLTGFRYNEKAITAQHLAGVAWFVGFLTPLAASLF